MPNPGDVIQAIDAAAGDLVWEHRRDLPEAIYDHVGRLAVTNRNLAILRPADHRHPGADNFAFALDAATGEPVWETRILDYRTHPADAQRGADHRPAARPSRAELPARRGPGACVITAHDALTGAELWRRRTTPAPGEPGDETWGGVPDAERKHVGAGCRRATTRAEPDLRRHVNGRFRRVRPRGPAKCCGRSTSARRSPDTPSASRPGGRQLRRGQHRQRGSVVDPAPHHPRAEGRAPGNNLFVLALP